MNVVDTHLHCWDRSRFDYAWLEGAGFPDRFTPADATVAASWSVRAVFMEADRAAHQAEDEARWALTLSNGAPGTPTIVGAIAHAPLHPGAGTALDAIAAVPGVRGVRRLLQDEPATFLQADDTAAGLRLVGERGLVFDACVRQHQLRDLAELAGAAPGTTIVLDHLGKPDVEDRTGARRGEWADGIAALAARPNVVVKLSGLLPTDGSFADVRPWVAACLERFGPGRAVLGSDWPVSRVRGVAYTDWFADVLEAHGLTGAEQDAVATGNAERVYRLGSPRAANGSSADADADCGGGTDHCSR